MVRIARDNWPRRLLTKLFDTMGNLPGGDPLLPPFSMRRFVGESRWDLTGRDFRANGLHFTEKLMADAGLVPKSRILDIGSGCGRIAVPLMQVLREPGSYVGLELSAPLVEWCASHITVSSPNFRFVHCDLHSPYYNPAGHGEPASYRLPFANGSFDVVAATSVFTHLLPSAANHYLQECSRVLSAGGRLFATFYLFDGESQGSDPSLRFDYEHGQDARFADVAEPEAAVAYRTKWVLEQASQAGMALVPPVRWGAWAGRPFTYSGQDVVILTKL